MKCWGCKTLSSLHKNGIVDFTTLKKLDPDSLNPTLTLDAVKNMLTKLFLVAGEMLEGDRKLRTQAQITASLMAVSASAMNLSKSDLKKIEEQAPQLTPGRLQSPASVEPLSLTGAAPSGGWAPLYETK